MQDKKDYKKSIKKDEPKLKPKDEISKIIDKALQGKKSKVNLGQGEIDLNQAIQILKDLNRKEYLAKRGK
jgi:hypothetical protein